MADEVGADLIVVGSKGMQGTRRILGSVPNSVAHKAGCHVLIAKYHLTGTEAVAPGRRRGPAGLTVPLRTGDTG